jgi:hypothetical protein
LEIGTYLDASHQTGVVELTSKVDSFVVSGCTGTLLLSGRDVLGVRDDRGANSLIVDKSQIQPLPLAPNTS